MGDRVAAGRRSYMNMMHNAALSGRAAAIDGRARKSPYRRLEAEKTWLDAYDREKENAHQTAAKDSSSQG